MAYFNYTTAQISPRSSTRIRAITIKIYIQDCTGRIYITDIMLQGGSVCTGWTGHPNEIQYTLDG